MSDPAAVAGPALLHSGNSADRWAWVLLQSLLLSLLGSLLVLGWRAALVVAGVGACTVLGRSLWRRALGDHAARRTIRPATVADWIGPALVACSLPAESAVWSLEAGGRSIATWPIIPAACLLLIFAQALRQRVAWLRFEPAVLAIVLLHVLLGSAMRPLGVVVRSHAIAGDVSDAREQIVPSWPWYEGRDAPPGASAVRVPAVSWTLDEYLDGRVAAAPMAAALTVDALLRESLPPLDDVAAAGVPAPIGMTSIALLFIAILHGGFRGVFDVRIPLLAVSACYAALVVLPSPIAIEAGRGEWRWLAPLVPGVGIDAGLTFVHYLVLGTPCLFASGVLANLGTVRPLFRRARLLWALSLGVLMAIALLYVSPVYGPYLAVLVMGTLSRRFDRLSPPHPLLWRQSLPQQMTPEAPAAVPLAASTLPSSTV